jgi:chromosome partitioning protein
MGKKIVFTNQKGGVGKTTSSLAMAVALARCGYTVLIVDCDDTGNPSLSKTLGADPESMGLTDLMMNRISKISVAPKTPIIDTGDAIQHHAEGIDYIAADDYLPAINAGPLQQLSAEHRPYVLKTILDEVKEKYDYILLDAAPALNTLSINLLTAADEVVIVTQAQGASEEGIISLIQTVSEIKEASNPNIVIRGLLVTMYDTRTNYSKAKTRGIAKEYTDLGLKVFQTVIPRSVRAEECMDKGKSIIAHDPRGKTAEAYKEFTNEYLGEEVK